MERLSVEILHYICSRLHPSDVTSFRLVNNLFSSIGFEYLLPSVTVYFFTQSLENLRKVSSHPSYRKHLRSIYFDANTIDYFLDSFNEYKKGVVDFFPSFQHEKRLRLTAPNNHQEWVKPHDLYVDILDQQTHMFENADYAFSVIRDALTGLTNLEKITMNHADHAGNPSFKPTSQLNRNVPCLYGRRPRESFPWSSPIGVDQLHAFLRAIDASQIKIKKLRAGKLSWSFFDSHFSRAESIARACESLTSINLLLHTGYDSRWDIYGTDQLECYKYMSRTSAIRKFLCRIPNLEFLKLRFDYLSRTKRRDEKDVDDVDDEEDEEGAKSTEERGLLKICRFFPSRFEHLIDDQFLWPKLKKFTLGGFQAQQSMLLNFLDSHRQTLKFLCLWHVELDPGGSWLTLLPDIQQSLALTDARMHGDFFARGAAPTSKKYWTEWWHLPSPKDEDNCDGVQEHSKDITHFLLHGGEIPLLTDDRYKYFADGGRLW
jgi:hypothetical protein